MELATNQVITTKNFSVNVCHDPYNKRIRIDDVRGSLKEAIEAMEKLAKETNQEKVIIKGRQEQFSELLEMGFQCEAVIDHYFLGSNCYFFCKYFNIERKNSPFTIEEDDIVKNVQKLKRPVDTISPPQEYQLKLIDHNDAIPLAKLYQQVFKIYPTPLHDPEYIKKTIDDGTIYYAFLMDGKVVSAASAEVNSFYQNAELTDCATLPEHRKHGLMKILLEKLEEELVTKGIYCSYSIARAQSFGMNAALHQLGYDYRGRLVNNCYIFDKIENMNVWVKDLSY